MKTFALRNARSGSILASSVARATNGWTRAIGLLPRKSVADNEGLWLGGCAAVHTLGMRATLDVYFLDCDDRVLKMAMAVRPNRFAIACRGAACVVELGAGNEAARDVRLGDRLVLE